MFETNLSLISEEEEEGKREERIEGRKEGKVKIMFILCGYKIVRN